MPRTLVCVSTYKKLPALRGWLDSFIAQGMHEGNTVCITDDNDGEAREVFEEYKDRLDLLYETGPNAGIAINKNRGLKVFLEGDWDAILLSDDDIKFLRPGLIEALYEASEADRMLHINTYLAGVSCDFKDPSAGFLHAFPPKAESEHLYWNAGAQGICSFYRRELVEKIGYFQISWPYFYGQEHSEYSARAMRMQGYCPEMFPHLKRSGRFLACQGIANNYEVDKDIVFSKQAQKYFEYLQLAYNGISLKQGKHGL